MRVLSEQDVADLIRGSSVFGTGGGYTVQEQTKYFDTLFGAKQALRLADCSDLDNHDHVCTCYILEPIGSQASSNEKLLELGMQALSRVTGKSFAALFAGEINIEGLIFSCATQLGIPVLDGDCTGGRAVPEITYDNFFLHGKSLLPAVGVTLAGDCFVLETVADIKNVEAIIRSVARGSEGNGVIVFDHPISVREARETLSLGTLSRSIRVGARLRDLADGGDSHDRWLSSLIDDLGAKIIACGTVVDTDLEQREGFCVGEFRVQDTSGAQITVWVKNENMICWREGEVHTCVPDLIVGIDIDTAYGLHNSNVAVGRRVALLEVPCTKQWDTPAGRTLFSPAALGFDLDRQRAV